jgi:hypothetical protein
MRHNSWPNTAMHLRQDCEMIFSVIFDALRPSFLCHRLYCIVGYLFVVNKAFSVIDGLVRQSTFQLHVIRVLVCLLQVGHSMVFNSGLQCKRLTPHDFGKLSLRLSQVDGSQF